MANWSNPTLTSLYTDFLSELKARDTDLALQFDGTTSSNLATGTIRWSSSANRWQKWNGTSWAELTTTYALTGLSTTGNASIGGTLSVTGATTLAAATATTPATNDNSTAIATTAYVQAQAYAPLASPALTGTPTAPTAAVSTNTTQLATTAFVLGQISNDALLKTGGTLTGALRTTAGTVTAPGVGIGEANTGLFRPSAGVLGFAVGGSESLRLNAAGGLGLGSTGTNANIGFRHAKSITGGTTAWAQLVDGAVQTDVTSVAAGIASNVGTAASTTLTSLVHFQASTGTLGAGTTITNQIGFSATSTMDGATNDFGFYGNIGAGSGNWNCYMVGAAANYFAGQVQLGAGSVSTPSLSTNGDTNTGIYFPAADTIGFVEGGAEAMRIDNSGRLLVGTSDTLSSSVNDKFQVAAASATGVSTVQNIYSFNTGGGIATLGLLRSNSNTLGTNTLVTSGQAIGSITFAGADGSNYISAARIVGEVDGTPGANDMPGRLVFSTTPDGLATPSPRMTIKADGSVGIGTQSPNALLEVSAGTAVSTNGTFRLAGTNTNGSASNFCELAATQDVDLTSSALTFSTRLSGTLSEKARIDKNGRLLVGTSSTSSISNTVFQGSSGNTDAAIIRLATNAATPADGAVIGQILFASSSSHSGCAGITALRDGGTWSASSGPSRLAFSTTANGATVPTERLRITSTGQVRLAGAGITFNGDTATANELDDYEEGTWTPTVSGSGTAGTYTLTGTYAYYTKIGNQVTVYAKFGFSAASGGTGNMLIRGLPVNYKANTYSVGAMFASFLNTTSSTSNGIAMATASLISNDVINPTLNIDNAATEPAPISTVSTSTVLNFTFSYTVS